MTGRDHATRRPARAGWAHAQHIVAAAGAVALLLGALGAPSAQDEEARRARATASKIELSWPIEGSGAVVTYVRKLGSRLAASAGPAPYPWRFVVVRDRSANAFAIGGGRIYVNEGVITAAENEAEVAAILAHEMGHQLAGHFRDTGRGRDDNAQIPLGGVTQEIDPAKELEADRESLRILAAAGYDPRAALAVAVRQQAQGGGASSHVVDPDRIVSLRAQLEGAQPGGKLDGDGFRALRDSLRTPAS